MVEETYLVSVPDGINSGDTFHVILPDSNKVYCLTCPKGHIRGTKMELKVNTMHGTPYAATDSGTLLFNNSESTVWSWWVGDLILMVLLITSIAVPKFAVQRIPSQCNPDVALPNELYYNFYVGVGTHPNCDTSGDNICIRWSDRNAWGYIDGIVGSYMEANLNYILTSQILLTLATIFAVAMFIYHTFLELKSTGPMHSGYIYSSAAGYMLGIWILALTSLNFFIGCDVMGESYWRELYLAGYTLQDVVDRSAKTPTVSASKSCPVDTYISDGALTLSFAIPFAFFSAIWIIILTCCCSPRQIPVRRNTPTTTVTYL